jgi:hypothetical protein
MRPTHAEVLDVRSMLFPSLVAACVILSSGCSGPPAADDDAGRDATAADGGASDAARDAATDGARADTGLDAAALVDAPATDDAGIDAASAADTGADAASASDAGLDAASATDAGTDAASATDGGTDGGMDAASASDAGRDAASTVDANLTTCAVSVSPPRGTSSDSFDFSVVTNGSTCSASLDGAAPVSVPCTGSTQLDGFSVGSHSVRFDVASGPSGPTSCSASFDVVAPDAGMFDGGPDAGITTCTIDVAPPTGSTSATFVATFSSNGSGCSLDLDGFSIGATSCVSTYSGAGSLIGAGTHTATLTVAGGPSGGTTCSDTFTVTP